MQIIFLIFLFRHLFIILQTRARGEYYYLCKSRARRDVDEIVPIAYYYNDDNDNDRGASNDIV